MRLARLSRALLCAAALASFASCNSSPTTPSTGASAVITLSVAPNPITSVITNVFGPTYTATWTLTMTESGAVGGVVQLMRASVFDNATGHLVAATNYDTAISSSSSARSGSRPTAPSKCPSRSTTSRAPWAKAARLTCSPT